MMRFPWICGLLLLALVTNIGAVCQCDSNDLCDPVRSRYTPNREIFMFTTNVKKAEYELYDWNKMTTLALTKFEDDDLICYGHQHNTSVVLMVSYSATSLGNRTAIDVWVNQTKAKVLQHNMDGAHLDFEGYIEPRETSRSQGLLYLFTSLSNALKSANPHMQVTIDFTSSPKTPNHDYPYYDLMKIADFAFIRTYGQRRWVYPAKPCFAWAMDANNVTRKDIADFEKLGIPASKLIPGFAWYGFDYPCEKLEGNTCFLELSSTGRCSVGKATAEAYSHIVEHILPRSTGQQRDAASGAPFANHKEEGIWRQVWYNDPESLKSRYALADELALRGVGAWIITTLDYTMTEEGKKMRQAMFDALPDWKNSTSG